MTIEPLRTAVPTPQSLIGIWRRFGLTGPVYEMSAWLKRRRPRMPFFRVRVVETGEDVDYRLSDILEDPRER